MSQTSAPVAQTASSNKQPRGVAAAKMPGLGANTAGLSCKGTPLTAEQIKVCNIALAVGAQLSAPTEALVALIYAGMGESSLGGGSGTFSTGGVWQTTGVPSAYSGGSDIAGQAHGFLTGGTSFNGSAISLARGGAPAWQIANQVENNAVWGSSHGDSYAHQFSGGQAQGIAEARAIVQAGGGGSLAGASGAASGGSTGVAQPYFFEVGSHESYWDAMNRLAQEVNWELITDGDRMYYDSEMVLIKQKPAAVVHRDDPAVVSWGDGNSTWDARHIATQLSLTLICDAFEFRPGEVLQLEGFGPYSTGSTAKLPGRWLISDFTRTVGDVSTQFTLVQPTRANLEPAPQIASAGPSATASVGGSTSLQGATIKAKIADGARKACAMQAANHNWHYQQSRPIPTAASGHPGLLNPAGNTTDCSGFSILCYEAAGAPPPSPNSYASGAGSTFDMEPHGKAISLSQASPGDLVFYPGHVALYLGGGQIANHGSEGEPVIESVSAPHGGAITSVRSYL